MVFPGAGKKAGKNQKVASSSLSCCAKAQHPACPAKPEGRSGAFRLAAIRSRADTRVLGAADKPQHDK